MAHYQMRFDKEEMTPDPPPEKPSFEQKLISSTDEEPQAKASETWWNRNRNKSVPVIALEQDVYRIKDQAFACISIIKPDEYGKLKHGEREFHGHLIKFRGVFPDREKAERHIQKIMKVDRHFDVHLIPAFQWSSLEDNEIMEREYATGLIGEVMKGYFAQENDRMMSLRDRIASTEDSENVRSIESTRFFEDAQKTPYLDDSIHQEQAPVDGIQTTLDELADRYGVQPGAKHVEHSPMNENQMKQVIDTVLLKD